MRSFDITGSNLSPSRIFSKNRSSQVIASMFALAAIHAEVELEVARETPPKVTEEDAREIQLLNGMSEFHFPDGTTVVALNMKNAVRKYNKLKK